MKVGNFGSFDENLKAKNISGLKNASKLDRQIWDEFNGNWSALSYESENLIARFSSQESNARPLGSETITEAKRRVNHDFFAPSFQAHITAFVVLAGYQIASF